MKFGLFLTLAASVVSAFHVEQIDDAKIEDAYKPCGCNRVQCSAALSDVAMPPSLSNILILILDQMASAFPQVHNLCSLRFSEVYM
jgi:hypothetical protein